MRKTICQLNIWKINSNVKKIVKHAPIYAFVRINLHELENQWLVWIYIYIYSLPKDVLEKRQTNVQA